MSALTGGICAFAMLPIGLNEVVEWRETDLVCGWEELGVEVGGEAEAARG